MRILLLSSRWFYWGKMYLWMKYFWKYCKFLFRKTLLQIDVQRNFLQTVNPDKSFQIVVLGNVMAHNTNCHSRQFLLANSWELWGTFILQIIQLLFQTTCLQITVPGIGFCKLLFLTSPCILSLWAILWHIIKIDILENLFVKFANCSSGQLSLQFIHFYKIQAKTKLR